MIRFQGHDEIKAVLQLFHCHVDSSVSKDRFLIFCLQIEGHQDHAVELAKSQRIIIIAELLLEYFSGFAKLCQRSRNFQSCLIKSGLVPVEHTAGHGYRNACQLAGLILHHIQIGFIPLCKIQGVRYGVQIQENISVGVEFVDPAQVDLVDIRRCSGLELKCSRGLPV